MPENSAPEDTEVILAAYAERVSDAFRVFAENLATGQSEQTCVVRFRRALDLMRKARDLALKAATQGAADADPDQQGRAADQAAEAALSAEDQALIDQALAGTTGHMPATPAAQRFRR